MPGDGTTPDGPYCLAILHVKRFSDGLQDPIIVIDAGSGVCSDCGRWHANGLPGMGWLRPVKGGFSVSGRKGEYAIRVRRARGERHSTWLKEELAGKLNWLPWGVRCTPSAGTKSMKTEGQLRRWCRDGPPKGPSWNGDSRPLKGGEGCYRQAGR